MKLPDRLSGNEFAIGLRREGRLLCWVAVSLDPSFHTMLVDQGEKRWPEATSLFYLWTPAEDWILESMTRSLMQYTPDHLSLHFDGIKVSSHVVGQDARTLTGVLEQTILTDTGYTVSVRQCTT